MDIQCGLVVGGVSVLLVAMGYGYKIKADKKSIKLEKNDQKQQEKDNEHEERIKKIEDKNGEEQHQIDELKEQLATEKANRSELKDTVIKLQKRIINCESNCKEINKG